MTTRNEDRIDTTGDSQEVALLRRAKHAAEQTYRSCLLRGRHTAADDQLRQVEALAWSIANVEAEEAMAAFAARVEG